MEDSELRDQFEEWAAPLRATRAPDVAALRSRIRRRMARIAAAAGSGLAVLGLVAGLLVAGGLAGNGKPGSTAPQSGAAYYAPPGQPYVFVNSSSTFVNQGDAPTTPAELRNAATGKVVAVLNPVGQGASFTNAVAAPDDRLFVLAQQDNNGTPSFAEVQINASGKAGPLHAILPHLSMPAGTQPESMTVNAAGTRLSFVADASDFLTGNLVVYNLQTGALIGSWPVSNAVGSSQFLGSGDEMVASVGGVDQGQNRLVDTSTAFRPGSSLLADSRPDRAQGFPGSFTQDGNMWVEAAFARLSPDGQAEGDEYLQEFSAATDKQLLKFPIGLASELNGPDFCGVLWTSANGDEVLAQCGTKQVEVVGSHVSKVRLAWILPDNPGASTNTFAW